MKLGALIKNIITDPGIGFLVVNAILFSGVSFTISVGSAVVILIMKIIAMIFDEKQGMIFSMMKNQKLSLFLSGVILFPIIGIAFYDGYMIAGFASLGFALFNILKPIELSDQVDQYLGLKQMRSMCKILKPEIFASIGTALAAVMVGPMGWWMAPFILGAGGLSLYNSAQPEYSNKGRPKLYLAGANIAGALLNLLTGNLQSMNAFYASLIAFLVYLRLEAEEPGWFGDLFRKKQNS